ncbi:unnamed protein product [Kuraishia capsulata CBS 1993]|uniref:Uncharacterized protein n=1 Tax=Kuraishia capsulata CBS 1993 TaxID=1382522 RepID=W6MS83_9ASCO|nr:uncharacterized protein KUCA_T00005246001 [Kuraishia capsulata CBS 1993]CDK29258.1 unnamed protein product [Kuraishia capsulata CBS 1993]
MEPIKDIPTIPKVLLARLFQTAAFEDDATRISSKTVECCTEYLRLFVKEAVIRSNEARIHEELETEDRFEIKYQKNATRNNVRSHEDDQNLDDSDVDDGQEGAKTRRRTVADATIDTRHLERNAGLLVLDF